MRLPKRSLLVLGLGLSLMISACDSPTDPGPPDELEPTLSSIQQHIFSPTCATSGCHAGPDGQEGLVLAAGQARANLVNVPSNQVPDLMRVEPGNPDDSYLILKLEGSDRIAPNTQRMPFGLAPLSQNEINTIRQWIAAGAQAN